MNKKKSQGSIEFMLILLFVFVIISLIMYFTGQYLIETTDKEQAKFAENYASKINTELRILSKVESGYKRELILYNRNYDVNIINSIIDNRPTTLEITDIYANRTFHFDLIGNYDLDMGLLEINLSERPDVSLGYNVTVISFMKKQKDEVNELDIS